MVSPKKARRGQKYTVRVNSDGTQQYKRRGCGASILLAVLAVVAVVLLAACDPQSPPLRGPKRSEAPATNMTNVRSLCDYVASFVDTPDARGNVGVKAEMSGIPASLKKKAVEYGRGPSADGQRLVLLECTTLGWSR